MSLYRFKSRETADLVMLEPDACRLLEAIGKVGVSGIIRVSEMADAANSLRNAAQAEELMQQQLREAASSRGEQEPTFDSIGLRQRSIPFLEMIRRCEDANVDIVWGI